MEEKARPFWSNDIQSGLSVLNSKMSGLTSVEAGKDQKFRAQQVETPKKI